MNFPSARVEQLTSTGFVLYANLEIHLSTELGHLKIRGLRLHPDRDGWRLGNPSQRTPAGERDVVTLPKALRPVVIAAIVTEGRRLGLIPAE